MPSLDSAARRALRARAHHLDPVVSIGQQGLTPTVMHEIEVALTAHELIKVRVFGDDRAARAALLETICAATEAAPVQQLGKLLVLWRPSPDAAKKAPAKARPGAGPGGKAATTRAARDATKAGSKGRAHQAAKRPASKGRARDAAKKPFSLPGARHGLRDRQAAGSGVGNEGSSQRARATDATASRHTPPAGVPRAALPRRRRARG